MVSRTRAFDTDAVLDAAVGAFWRRGYEATSLADLEEATGLSRSSLYQAFDSKHGLFTAALERYRLTNIDPALAAMEAPGAGADALHGYFTILATTLRSDPGLAVRGCLIVNAMTERGGHDPAARAAGLAYLQRVTAAITNALQGAARDDGERAAVTSRARILCAALIGALVTAHLDPHAAAQVCAELADDTAPHLQHRAT